MRLLHRKYTGRRANPRAKPPHTAAVGLWGRPTNVNNVETLSNVPHILRNGSDWYKGLSYTDEGGTKIYGVSGRVKRPGWWELPMGTIAREIIEEHAGGMADGYHLRGFLPGALLDAGLYCRADNRGDPVVQVAPPLVCDGEHFDEMEQILRDVLTEAADRV